MKYYIDYCYERIYGTVVDSNGIYSLVRFDIDPLGDLLESIVWIIKDYFPNYSDYDENKYVYGLGIGSHLVVKGPGSGGSERSDNDIRSSIKWCEEQIRTSSPENLENKTAEDIYSMLHGAVKKQFQFIEENVPKIWKNKCSLGELSCDLEHEWMYVDILKDDYKLRVLLKCFSANIAHQHTDTSFQYRYFLQGVKATIGVQLISGKRGWDLDLSGAILDLVGEDERRHFVFDDSDEDGYYSGDYECAVVVDYLSIAQSFIHVVYTLVQTLSEYDPIKAEEEAKKRMEIVDDTDWDNFELPDDEDDYKTSLERREPYVPYLENRGDYCDYFNEWLDVLCNLECED